MKKTKTLIDLFNTFKNRRGKTVFVYRTGVRRFVFLYKDLYTLSRKMACWLQEQEVEKGDRVILWAPNSPWWAIAFWGIILRGAVVVPVDFVSEKKRVRTIKNLTKAKFIIQSQYKIEKFGEKRSILIEEIEYTLEEVKPGQKRRGASRPDVRPSDTAEIIYTSGTTGVPKGVVLTHKNLATNLLQVNKHIPVVRQNFQFLSLLPLSHVFEQMGGFLLPLSSGARIVYIKTLKPSAIMGAFMEEDIYAVVIVPKLLGMLKKSIEHEFAAKNLGAILRLLLAWCKDINTKYKKKIFYPIHKKFGRRFVCFVSGGAPLNLDIAHFWKNLGFTLIEGYGLTECSPVLTANTIEDNVVGSVGKPLPGIRVKIDHKENEIFVKGDNIFPGYYKNKKATKEVFTASGWFKTGDIGAQDKSKNLFISGRKKDLIVTSAGVNVFPNDIEYALDRIPGVKESCVVGIDHGEGEEVHAVLITAGERSPRAIVHEANAQLDPSQQISRYSRWPEEEFPKTTTLKTKRFQVKERVMIGKKEKRSASPDKLIQLISNVTGKSSKEIFNRSVFATDLGLTSISRLELINYIEQTLHCDMEDTFIDGKTTVADLRKIISQKEGRKEEHHLRLWTAAPWLTPIRRAVDAVFHYPLFKLFLSRWEAEGLKNIKGAARKTPFLLISNHISHADHGAIYFKLPPQIRYRTASPAREEFFFQKEKNVFKKMWKRFTYEYATILFNVFVFPQARSFRPALRHMGKLIDRGVNILIFPEGARSRDGKLQPFMNGLGLIVQELKVPVIPIKISGIKDVLPIGARFPKRGRVRIMFGKPLYFTKESPAEIRDRAYSAIKNL